MLHDVTCQYELRRGACDCGGIFPEKILRSAYFRPEHHKVFSRLFVEGEDAASNLYDIDGQLIEGEHQRDLKEIRDSLRAYRNLLLKQVGNSPL